MGAVSIYVDDAKAAHRADHLTLTRFLSVICTSPCRAYSFNNVVRTVRFRTVRQLEIGVADDNHFIIE
jgi:hypothetical protein